AARAAARPHRRLRRIAARWPRSPRHADGPARPRCERPRARARARSESTPAAARPACAALWRGSTSCECPGRRRGSRPIDLRAWRHYAATVALRARFAEAGGVARTDDERALLELLLAGSPYPTEPLLRAPPLP